VCVWACFIIFNWSQNWKSTALLVSNSFLGTTNTSVHLDGSGSGCLLNVDSAIQAGSKVTVRHSVVIQVKVRVGGLGMQYVNDVVSQQD